MLSLLHRYAFRGTRPPDAPSLLEFAGETRFDGVVAATAWARDEIASRLPAELEPAPPASGATMHPVLFVFGEQREPALLRGGVALPFGRPFGELGVIVPYVRAVGGRRLLAYVWRMCSTYFPAVWEGNTRYFAKTIGVMAREPERFSMTSPDGRALLRAVVGDAGPWGATRDHATGVAAVRDALALPVVGRTAAGHLVAAPAAWDFGSARVRPVAVRLVVDGSFIDETVPRELDVPPAGALAVEGVTWRLGWPGSLRD